jgi:hypothetical protein
MWLEVVHDQEQFKFNPNICITQRDKREIISTVISIAVKVMFSTHVYTFGGEFYRQTSGGPIGLRSTCAVARLVMKVWDDKWLERLALLKVQIEEAMRYMDDGRTALYRFKCGWRWSMGKILYCKRWELEDKELSGLEITKRIVEGTMKGLEEYLVFTMETESDFENGWLPTLDTELQVTADNMVLYRFYEKPTNPNTVLHMRTAMAEDSKIRSLSNEVIRRLLNTSEDVPDSVRCAILDTFAQKLYNSGYGLYQIRRIILGGIKGYEGMRRTSRRGRRQMHRSAGESSQLRAKKKLTEKSEWFRKTKSLASDPVQILGPVEMAEKAAEQNLQSQEKSLDRWLQTEPEVGKTASPSQEENPKVKNIQTRTVLFVENTRGGDLAKRLREVEKRTCEMVGFKTKIVERVGTKLQHLLPNTKGAACGRVNCIPCGQEGETKQDCRIRNIIYESKCLICNPEEVKGKKDGKELKDVRAFPSIYVGESGRSLYERAAEHWGDYVSKLSDSHILKHWELHHGGFGSPSFKIRVIKYCRDADLSK